MDQVRATFSNSTFKPSSMDLLLAVPRLAQRAGEFALGFVPEQLDGIWKKAQQPSMIAESTTSQIVNATMVSNVEHFHQGSPIPSATATAAAFADPNTPKGLLALNFQVFSGIFGYLISKWAIATVAMVSSSGWCTYKLLTPSSQAILLNRTTFYASSRVPLTLRWHVRLAVYIVPILTFLYQTQWMLQALKCQTSPSWSEMQYGNATVSRSVDFAGEGGFIYHVSSFLVFWESDASSCAALDMLPPKAGGSRAAGSLDLLWPFFCSVLLSQFVETLACALQGRQVMPENGLTIWEHSLAFAEAEATFTRPLAAARDGLLDTARKTALLHNMNAPPEVLIVTLISSLSHLTSNVLAVLGLRTKLRLANTAIWGLSYMGVLIWGFFRSTITNDPGDLHILRFPGVCLIGFVPHIIIFTSILACVAIYGIALLLTAISLPRSAETVTLRQRFLTAYRNLQANSHISSNTTLRLNYQEDFFTALLKVGFAVLTAASEAVFLNEGTRVNVAGMTWLEDDRIQEMNASRNHLMKKALEAVPEELRGEGFDEDINAHGAFISGYARERKPDSSGAVSNNYRAVSTDTGVGFLRRSTKFGLSLQLLKGFWWLQVGFGAQFLQAVLMRLGLARPSWLMRFVQQNDSTKRSTRRPQPRIQRDPKTLQFWTMDEFGQMRLATNQDIDVEVETRRRLLQQPQNAFDRHLADEALDDNLYNWWKIGGWWSEADSSGEYHPTNTDDDDTTSVVSTVEDAESMWSDVSDDEDGRRTPTQRDPHAMSRQSTPMHFDLLDTERLASLLNPRTREEQEEAQLLSRHLRSEKIMTRSQYHTLRQQERGRILTSSRFASQSTGQAGPLSAEQEEHALEELLLERRSGSKSGGGSWDSGAEGMGSNGPQCVVCQTSPRTILMWPCGCLSLCDDCRLGLATRNFDACVCCRRKVISYSRMYVP